jgi:hypothetical protein
MNAAPNGTQCRSVEVHFKRGHCFIHPGPSGAQPEERPQNGQHRHERRSERQREPVDATSHASQHASASTLTHWARCRIRTARSCSIVVDTMASTPRGDLRPRRFVMALRNGHGTGSRRRWPPCPTRAEVDQALKRLRSIV